MKIAVLNSKGKETGREVTLPKEIFSIEPNEHALYLDVKQYLANQRQGTHKAKERADITGSTRKIKRQKGTGTARAGSIKSGIFRGGGRIFGPRPVSCCTFHMAWEVIEKAEDDDRMEISHRWFPSKQKAENFCHGRIKPR